jgi:hypothetical protein
MVDPIATSFIQHEKQRHKLSSSHTPEMKTSVACVLTLLLSLSEQGQAQSLSSSVCSNAFIKGKHETATELICTAATTDDDISVSIQYSCEGDFSNNNNSTSLISITSDMYCTGFKEQSNSTTTEWSCAAFADDTDFSEFIADVKASNLTTCANGSTPLFRFISTGTDSNVDECLETATSGTFVNVEPYETLTQASGLFSYTSETVVAPCGPVSPCHQAYRNLNVPAGAGTGLKCSDKERDLNANTQVEFACFSSDFYEPESELANVYPRITSNVYCESNPDPSDPLFTWECSAFSEGTDFSRFLQEAEDTNFTCASGEPPIFQYKNCNTPEYAPGCDTHLHKDFNETLANGLHSIYVNHSKTSSGSGSQIGGGRVEQRMMVIVATITAGSFILLFL